VSTQKKNIEFPEIYATEYLKMQSEIENRLQDFLSVQEKDWFYEACYCILTPQSKAVHAEMLRDILTAKIRGFGMKESAHFMRNIGIFGPTILDRHILKHLLACGVKSGKNPPTNKSMYLRIEKAWLKYCKEVQIDMESMDLLFWSMETGFILK